MKQLLYLASALQNNAVAYLAKIYEPLKAVARR
jgi:hypothetical protein